MKKLLLSVSLLFAMGTVSAQDIILTDDFAGLTVGDIGTDITGTTPGQGGYFTFVTGGANSDFQIVADTDVDHGNILQITGSATALNSRFMWKPIADEWAGRTTDNDYLEVEFDIYTGPVTTSKNNSRVIVYAADGTTILAGLSLVQDTKVISGVAYYDNSGTLNNYLFNLGATPVVLPADTWIRMGMSFNYLTGEVIWRCAGYFDGFIGGAAGFTDAAEVDFVQTAGATNLVSSMGKFDNVVVRASATDTLLGTDNVVAEGNFSIYPNPANNVINVANPKNVNAVVITDMNGRVVKQNKFEGLTEVQMNIADLASGIYMMTVSSDAGSTTKKIVKQ